MRKKNLMTLNLQFFAEDEVSENTPEVAEMVENAPEVESDTEVSTETESDSTEDSNVQSAEENAKYAAARRRAEQELAERLKEEDAEYERRFAGYVNPITNQPIRSKKDYFEALDAQDKLRRDEELRQKGIDPSVFEEMVNRQVANNPTVLQAQAMLQATKQAEIQNRIEEDLKAIKKLDSSIKTLDDVLNSPNAPQMLSYVQNNNMSLVDAYKMVNFDALMANSTKGAKQAVINNIKGTQHLNSTDGVSTHDDGGVDIPTDELSTWKRAYPELSMAELRKKYNKVL